MSNHSGKSTFNVDLDSPDHIAKKTSIQPRESVNVRVPILTKLPPPSLPLRFPSFQLSGTSAAPADRHQT